MRIFIICPVRSLTEEENTFILEYIRQLEDRGHSVHYPPRDTNQDDPIGINICLENANWIDCSDRVDIYWTDKSKGSLFDLGMAFALHKPIKLINKENLKRTPNKSFINVLFELDSKNMQE